MEKKILSENELLRLLTEKLQDLMDCPSNVDPATAPLGVHHQLHVKNGSPNDIVLNYSVSYARVLDAKEALKAVADYRIAQLVADNPLEYKYILVFGSNAQDLKVEMYDGRSEYAFAYKEYYGWHSIQEGYCDGKLISQDNKPFGLTK